MFESQETRSHRLRLLREIAAALEGMCAGHNIENDFQAHPIRSLMIFYEELSKWGPKDPAEAQQLRDQVACEVVAEALRSESARAHISQYISETEDYVEHGRYEGYRPACEHRSAIQLLIDDFVDYMPLSTADSTWLAEIDEELTEVSQDAPPPHREEVPSWVPNTHWWWAPKRTDMSMREYRERIFGASLEGVDGTAPGSADWLRCRDERCWCATAPG